MLVLILLLFLILIYPIHPCRIEVSYLALVQRKTTGSSSPSCQCWWCCDRAGGQRPEAALQFSEGLGDLVPDSKGTGDVASIRAGFRMIGSDMGGTPTCRGDASGCRMSGGWLRGDPWVGDAVIGAGLVEGGTGEDRSDPVHRTRDKIMRMEHFYILKSIIFRESEKNRK